MPSKQRNEFFSLRTDSGPDGAGCYQLVAFVFAQTEQLAEDVVEILADFGRYPADFARPGGKLERYAGDVSRRTLRR